MASEMGETAAWRCCPAHAQRPSAGNLVAKRPNSPFYGYVSEGAPLPPDPDPEQVPADAPVESSEVSIPAAATPSAPAEAPPPEAGPDTAGPVVHPIRFHGQAGEYFRIWAVNTLLTLLTAGVFLAWAKVRKRRYLRGCTELMGHRFDYRADPKRILFGNIIVFLFFISYGLFGVVYPAIRYGVIVLGVVFLPWIVVRSLTFNAHNTLYRGMRFRFSPSLSASAMVYLLEPLLIVVTLGFYYPAWVRSKRRYMVSHHRLGDAYFHFDGRAGPFYLAYLIGGAILMGVAFLVGVVVAVAAVINSGGKPSLWITLPVLLIYGLGLFFSRQMTYAQLFNHLWNHTRLDDHRFSAKLETGRWLALQFKNLGAIIVTCGLAYPWTLIRTQAYLASCLTFEPAGPVETIERLGGQGGSGVGDSAAEFIGLDFGL